jgi:protoporphyrinogen oxidase
MLGLMEEIGLRDKVVYHRPKTVVYHKGEFYPLDSPLAALTFPGFSFLDMVRFGFVTIYLKYLASWKPLEKQKAHEWLRRFYGKRVYETNFEPLLKGKFGDHFKEVNMAWFWARFKARTTNLGTYKGGFQAFADDFADILRQKGVEIRLSTAVQQIKSLDGKKVEVQSVNGNEIFDRCLVTLSPGLMARMAPDLPQDYLKGLLDLKSMGAVVMVLALRRKLSTKGYYWYSMPKSAGYPFLALVEHTNFVSPNEFGGDHIVYCGDYLDVSHEYFSLSQAELLDRFVPHLKKINPEFNTSWVRKNWLFKANYAQPIPLVNHSKNIPAIRTPLAGVYFASMSQVYPWDRGTNFAVQIGREAARLILADE